MGDADVRITIHLFQPLDSGLGREAGFRDDAEMIAAHEAERAALPPEVRKALEAADLEMDRRFLFGA